MPVTVAQFLRKRAPESLRRSLSHGGIPTGVDSFGLSDETALRFTNTPSLVLQQLYWLGTSGWEPEVMRWWLALCRRSETIVELGANVGYFTVRGALAAPKARYIAVEPHPNSVATCKSHLDLNGVASVELVAAAAVPERGPEALEMHVPSDQLATPTVAFLPHGSELPRDMAQEIGATIEVAAVDVRTLVSGADLIKLDVEGQEHLLLGAIVDVLAERRPHVVVEMLTGTPKLRALLSDLCVGVGYHCYVPVETGLVELESADIATVNLQSGYGTNDVILSIDATLLSRT